MSEETKQVTGCILEPTPLGMASVETILGSAVLPDNFIASYYRKYFVDENGNYLDPSDPRWGVNFPIKQQRGVPSCVGESTSYAKAADEGEEMSGRDTYRLCKAFEGGDPLSYGTRISTALTVQEKTGVATAKVVPDASEKPLVEYVSLADVTPAVEADRANHKTKRDYSVPRTMLLDTIFQTDKPLVTSLMWYSADNAIGADGIMGPPKGANGDGHAVCWIGHLTINGKVYAVSPNSFGKYWAHKGFFLVDVGDPAVMNRFGNGYVSVDISNSLADVLATYNGKNVQVPGDARVYRIEGGKKRWFENEIVFWAHGFLFGQDIVNISDDELCAVPEGAAMSIDDAPQRELVRQIRQFYGKL